MGQAWKLVNDPRAELLALFTAVLIDPKKWAAISTTVTALLFVFMSGFPYRVRKTQPYSLPKAPARDTLWSHSAITFRV